MPLVDLHCHLLPGVDDGPATFAETLALLREAHETGIRSLAATPHMFRPPFRNDDAEAVRRSFAETAARVAAAGAEHPWLGELSLHPGSESFVSPEFFAALDRNGVVPLGGGPYLLVEFSSFSPLQQIATTAARVRAAGLRPLMAHVERYPVLLEDPRAVGRLVEEGCAISINAESLLRSCTPRAQRRACLRLLKLDLVHVIASDSHGPRTSTARLAEAYGLLKRRFSPERAERWTEGNPGAVLAGRMI